MYSRFQIARKYLHYYFTSSNGKGHGTHSPFVYDFIINVLNDKKEYDAYSSIESLRDQLKKDNRILEIEDFGAGSVVSKTNQRSVAEIVRNAAKPKKLAQLLFRIVQYYRPNAMLELGTSLGISSAYLASGNANGKLITIEGSQAIAETAAKNFQLLKLTNIELATGNFDIILPHILQNSFSPDFVFIDGNHRKEPTLNYFHQLLEKRTESSLFIFDDIHWSSEMESAWKEIKNHPSVMLTIDLFFIGLVFFRPEFKVKQDFIIRF
ncbi:MAG: class I SAM-dependent methyltransferase [Bacteroidetes bacterium]|nr:class I SAM-dependent methyltransferase [Bacteroidota bacterium]MBS1934885.1 class I SAM-dependent methyltransferase [Bacteroidota bacterium]